MGNDHAKERRKSSDASGFELDPKVMRHLSAKARHHDDFLDMPLHTRAGSQRTEGRRAAPHRPRATTEVSRPKAGRFAGFMEKRSGNREKVSSGESPNSKETKLQTGTGQKRLPTIFKYNGKADEVFLCGSFNNWQRLPMSRSTKDFVAIVDLAVGDHEYKFLADGKWVHDSNLATVDCSEGGKNNLIHVQKEDFNAYDALAMDSRSVNLSKKNSSQTQQVFGQNIPPAANQMFDANGPGRLSGPPILPPQLLQVILNQDTLLSCEPTLLPEPNHVMINHLYALSIKDGVMVLSSTHRFRKKYVTTLLYKPMGSRIPD